MSMFKRRLREVPGLNTASLPDLIFTVLFFFMIVTHMRTVTLKVKYQVPQGTELTQLARKSTASYIFIGTPLYGGGKGQYQIQLNDKVVTPQEITEIMMAERRSMSDEDIDKASVSIKADRGVRMQLVNEVKTALRRAGMLKIYYSASEGKKNYGSQPRKGDK